ncbi:MAG TPA: low molecular weight phosphotyrosine protein phosphatase, partial [Verrucomicrobiaceae bacterium]
MRLLFVCMGNICRSPAAEGVMRAKLEEAGLDKKVEVDSAGTIDFHAGKLPDRRMILAAAHRGLKLDHRARQIRGQDLN